MATENEKFLEDEKNSWNAIHGVAADIAKKNTAAKIENRGQVMNFHF